MFETSTLTRTLARETLIGMRSHQGKKKKRGAEKDGCMTRMRFLVSVLQRWYEPRMQSPRGIYTSKNERVSEEIWVMWRVTRLA